MRVFVINLSRDKDRRESIKRKLYSQHIDFDFFEGVDASNLKEKELMDCYDDKKAKLYRSRSLTSTEIAISLSHVGIYKKVITESIPLALILEDDVCFNDDLSEFISAYESVFNKVDPILCLLSPAKYSLKSEISYLDVQNSRYGLYLFMSGVYASSYIINYAAASVLYKQLYPVCDVADCWDRINKHTDVKILVASPSLTYQDQETFGSSTTDSLLKSKYNKGFNLFLYKIRRIKSLLYSLYIQYVS